MAQLKAGKIAAAGVNGKLMQAYAAREGFRIRVPWESSPMATCRSRSIRACRRP